MMIELVWTRTHWTNLDDYFIYLQQLLVGELGSYAGEVWDER